MTFSIQARQIRTALSLAMVLLLARSSATALEPRLLSNEALVGGHRSLIDRKDQRHFNYDSAEYRFVGHGLFKPSRSTREYLGFSLGRPRDDFGSYVFAGFIGIRRNLACIHRPGAYMQLDTGVFITDAYKRHEQRLIGQAFEFRTRATLGHSIILSRERRLRLLVEANYEHISNAGMSRRNLGADDFAFSLGFAWSE